MEKPNKPWPPSEYEYRAKIERRYIYGYKEIFDEEDREIEDDDEDVDYRGKKCPCTKPIEEVDLAWLLKQLPEDVKPEQVKIEFGYNASSMAYEDHYIRFYYELKVPARKAEFKAAMKKYEEELAQYEKNLAEYERKQREEEIKKTEAKLAQLKGQK